MATTASTIQVKIAADVANFARDMERATHDVKRFERSTKDIGQAFASIGRATSGFTGALVGIGGALPDGALRRFTETTTTAAFGLETATRSVGELRKAFATLQTASALVNFAALATPVGLLAAGVGALVYEFYRSGQAARDAKKEVEKFKASLTDPTISSVRHTQAFLQGQFDAVSAQLQLAQQRMPTVRAWGSAGSGAGIVTGGSLAEINQLKAAQQALAEKMFAVGQRAAEMLGTPAEQAKRAVTELAGRVQLIVSGFKQVEAGIGPIPGLTQAWADAMRDVMRFVNATGNGLSTNASAARDLVVALRQVDPLAGLGALPAVSRIGEREEKKFRPLKPLIPSDIALPEIDLGPRLDTQTLRLNEIKDVARAGFQNMINAMVTVLPVALANVIGGRTKEGQIGSLLGGAFGGGVGSKIANTIWGKITETSTLGAFAGSAVLPVIGSLAFGFLGSAIGDFFGRPRKAVDDLTTGFAALNKQVDQITESISNLPTGIKIAAYRFNASDPAEEAFMPRFSRPRNYIYIAELKVSAENANDFVKQLSAAAETNAARGGASGFSLAAGQVARGV